MIRKLLNLMLATGPSLAVGLKRPKINQKEAEDQCDQIGLFLKILCVKFSLISSPNVW